MSLSGALRAYSKTPFTFLCLLTLFCLFAASGTSVHPLIAVSAASQTSAGQRITEGANGFMGNSTTPAKKGEASTANSNSMNVGLLPYDGGAVLVSLLPNVNGAIGSTVTVPITVSDVTGLGVLAYDLQVTYNPAVLRPATTPYDKAGTVSSGMVITPNPNHSGHLIISAFEAEYASGSGTLLNLMFVVVGLPGQSSGLTFEDYTDPIPRFHAGFRFNAGSPQANTTSNNMTVNGPTAAAVNASGQVLTSDGQPINGATITVMGGVQRLRAVTDSNGYYKVENLEAGRFYTVTPTRANYEFAPRERSFSPQANSNEAVFTGLPAATQLANPLDTTEYFVRQQYLDFLAREPDQGGLEYWSARLDNCSGEALCLRQRRIDVSTAFFIEQEFQQTGAFIYGLYKGALGRAPQFAEYTADRGQVPGGIDMESRKQIYADSFVERAEFTGKYQTSTSAESFVDALLVRVQQSSGVDLSGRRQNLISLYRGGTTQTNSRGLVLRALTDSTAVRDANYNAAFVLAEYFGYLRRDPDQGGSDFWLNVLNNRGVSNYRGMVCAFSTAIEYQLRFGSVVRQSDSECGQ